MVAVTIRFELKFGKLKYINLRIRYKNVKVKMHPVQALRMYRPYGP